MNTKRFSGLFDMKDIHVTLIGLGGIGSWTLLGLAKMGVQHLSAYDPDTVSSENVATQLYGQGMIGHPKTEAIGWLLSDLTQEDILEPYPYAILPSSETIPPTRFLISAVDSIHARKDIWDVARRSMWEWYIDARMSAMSMTIHCVNYNHREWYQALLDGQDDNQIADEPCTSKATPFTGMIAGGFVTWTVAQLYRGERVGKVLCLDLTGSLNTQTI
jgi:molybdopterin/thiamine biosynthesis adenylyltransferase